MTLRLPYSDMRKFSCLLPWLTLLILSDRLRSAEPPEWSFRNHVLPVLSKAGCNTGGGVFCPLSGDNACTVPQVAPVNKMIPLRTRPTLRMGPSNAAAIGWNTAPRAPCLQRGVTRLRTPEGRDGIAFARAPGRGAPRRGTRRNERPPPGGPDGGQFTARPERVTRRQCPRPRDGPCRRRPWRTRHARRIR